MQSCNWDRGRGRTQSVDKIWYHNGIRMWQGGLLSLRKNGKKWNPPPPHPCVRRLIVMRSRSCWSSILIVSQRKWGENHSTARRKARMKRKINHKFQSQNEMGVSAGLVCCIAYVALELWLQDASVQHNTIDEEKPQIIEKLIFIIIIMYNFCI